jgi:hypothetical protein
MRQGVAEQVQRAAIEGRSCHDLVTCRGQIHDCIRHSC